MESPSSGRARRTLRPRRSGAACDATDRPTDHDLDSRGEGAACSSASTIVYAMGVVWLLFRAPSAMARAS
jgi:hypothetical protein